MERITEIKIVESDRDKISLNRRLDRFFPKKLTDFEEPEDLVIQEPSKYFNDLDEHEQSPDVNNENSLDGLSDRSSVEGSDIGSLDAGSEANDGGNDAGSDAGGGDAGGDGDGGN
jgi:hypothetical protein